MSYHTNLRLRLNEVERSLLDAREAADYPAAIKILDRDPPPSDLWPDDPEEERLHGPTVEPRGWRP